MKGLPTSRLMELKTTLQIMTDSALIEESEMVNILNKAGLYKYKHAKHTNQTVHRNISDMEHI